MEITGKAHKFAIYFQATPIIDNYGKKKVQLKYFKRNDNGKPNYQCFQVIYIHASDWKHFKEEMVKAMKLSKKKT